MNIGGGSVNPIPGPLPDRKTGEIPSVIRELEREIECVETGLAILAGDIGPILINDPATRDELADAKQPMQYRTELANTLDAIVCRIRSLGAAISNLTKRVQL